MNYSYFFLICGAFLIIKTYSQNLVSSSLSSHLYSAIPFEQLLLPKEDILLFLKQCFDESRAALIEGDEEYEKKMMNIILENRLYRTIWFIENTSGRLVGFVSYYYYLPHDEITAMGVCCDNKKVDFQEVVKHNDREYRIHIRLLKVLFEDCHKGISIPGGVFVDALEIIQKEYKEIFYKELSNVYFAVFLNNPDGLGLANRWGAQREAEEILCAGCENIRKKYRYCFDYFSLQIP